MKAHRWISPALLGLLAAGALLAHEPLPAGPESVPAAPPPFQTSLMQMVEIKR